MFDLLTSNSTISHSSSSDYSDEEEHEIDNPAPRNRRDFTYELERVFGNKQDCEDFIKAENSWKHVRDRATANGMKGEYRCMHCKARGIQCSANVYTIFGKTPNDPRVELWRRANDHDHDTSQNKVTALSSGIKEIITGYLDDSKTLKKILTLLRKRNDIEQPDKNKVQSFIKAYRRTRFG